MRWARRALKLLPRDAILGMVGTFDGTDYCSEEEWDEAQKWRLVRKVYERSDPYGTPRERTWIGHAVYKAWVEDERRRRGHWCAVGSECRCGEVTP